MMKRKKESGDEITSISELEEMLNIPERKLKMALKRLEKNSILQINGKKQKKSDLKKYNCRYQEICKHYYPEHKTCREDGGIGFGDRPYCGKYREYDKIFAKKSRKNLLNFKNLLLEINPEHDIF